MHSRKHISDEFSHQPFRDLKKLLEKKKRELKRKPAASVMSFPSKQLHDEDMFRDAMKGVEEIREFRDIPLPRKKSIPACTSKNRSFDKEALRVLEDIISHNRPLDLSGTQEYVEWIDPDYREDILARLHRGEYAVQDCLDLHGHVVEEGKIEVDEFFREALRRRYRCIKIIHGRGLRSVNGPVMKQALVTWLLRRYRRHIIAFVTARQCDGGLGALYVLLK